MLQPRRFVRFVVTHLPGLLVLLGPAFGHALQNGQNFACNNCHEGQDKPAVSATFSAPRVEPGASVGITVTTTHATALVGGVLVDSKGFGTFEIVEPTETHLFEGTPTQVTHVAPKSYTDGQVEFAFLWVAPDMVGPFEFEIWANAANDNLDAHDDSATGITGHVAVGCDALWYYLDGDGDGWGDEASAVYSCEPLPDSINQGGDCDDQNPAVNSGTTEVCNDIDDDCDGEVDQGFERMLWVEDRDGDGFGSLSSESRIRCAQPPGFGVGFDDCNDDDPAVNPDAVEVINGIDDNCDGQRDEMAVAPSAGGSPEAPAPSLGAGGTPASPAPSPGAVGTPGASSGAASSGPAVMPVGVGGTPGAPGQSPLPVGGGGAGAPGLSPAAASSSGTSCAVRRVSASAPAGVPTVIAGLALLWRRRRA